jgi:RHS repeat-associated protein
MPLESRAHATGRTAAAKMNQPLERGFTGHEHLDDVRLIHMNGRVYDYALGRFLSVDPIISNPANSQSLNPYWYIGNNPLSGVDPTGYTESIRTTHYFESHPPGGSIAGEIGNHIVTIQVADSSTAQQNGAQGMGAKASSAGSHSDQGSPQDISNREAEVSRGKAGDKQTSRDQQSAHRADQGLPVPSDLVPITPGDAKLAQSLQPQVNERINSGKEESLPSSS